VAGVSDSGLALEANRHRPWPRHARPSDLAIDLSRAALLLAKALRLWLGPLVSKLLRRPSMNLSRGERIREALQELGLTYVKLGQFLAMRFDILPADVCRELMKLFEDVHPVPFRRVQETIESEFDRPLDELFMTFEREPVATASVAQVHEARTRTGERVAVKVQRPGIERIFASDMRNLLRVAAIVDALGLLGELSAVEYAGEFASWTRRELDFVAEGRTAEHLGENALAYEGIPGIHWELTARRVLTMDFIDGVSLNSLAATLETEGLEGLAERYAGLDISVVARRVAFASLRQIFVKGFFHGDPHPGNVLIRADNTFTFIDFGIAGDLTDYLREQLTGAIENVALGDIDRSFYFYAKLADPTVETDLRAFEREAKTVLRAWYEAVRDPQRPPAERHLGKYLGEVTEALRTNRLRMSPETLLFWRSLHALDSTAQRFGSYFDILSALREFFEQTRPGLAHRALDAAAHPNRTAAVADLWQLSRQQLPLVRRNVTRISSNLLLHEARKLRRSEDRNAKLAASAIVAISLVTVVAAHHEPAVRLAGTLALILLALAALAEVRRA
jgi:ubiquinone biosynthesis protein